MHADIAAFDLQVSALRRGEDFLFGAGGQAGGRAGEGDFLVGGCRGLAALALQADLAAGGVQVDAGFAVRFVAAGFADGEEREAVFGCQAVVALGDQVGVLVAGDAKALAGDQQVVFRGELGDAAGGGVLDARFAPGGNAAGAALRGFDVAAAGRLGALGGGGAHDFTSMFQGVYRR